MEAMEAFFRVPKQLFLDPLYQSLSFEAKGLYALLLDRSFLSARTGWRDEKGRVYVYCTLQSIMAVLGCCKQKAVKLLDELEIVGLIERKRQFLGQPNRIYVKPLISRESKFKNCENQNSGALKIEIQEG